MICESDGNMNGSKLNRFIVVVTSVAIFIFWTLLFALVYSSAKPHGLSEDACKMLGALSGVMFLLVIAIPYHRWVAPLEVGRALQRRSILPMILVVVLYLGCFGYESLTGQPPEPWMVDFLGKSGWQMFLALVSSLVLAPIGEEILFRGILLNMFGSSRTWVLGIGVVLVALFFAWTHTQYQSTSTAVQLFALSVVFSWARLRSGGLLLPVLLHALASVLGIFVAWIQVAVL